MARPLAFLIPLADLPLLPLLVPFTYLETLLAVTGSGPPWSQVTRKLTSLTATLSHSLPPPNSQYPG
jgi:hypothetical protein